MALPFEVPADFAAATDEELRTVKTQANAAAKPLLAKGTANLTPEEKATLRELGAAAASASQEDGKRQTERAKQAAEAKELVDQFSVLDAELNPAAPAPVPAVPAVVPAAAPAFDAAPVAPVIVPSVRDIVDTAPTANVDSVATADVVYGRMKYAPKSQLTEFTGLKQLGKQLVEQMNSYGGFRGDYVKDPLLVFERTFPDNMRGPIEGRGDKGLEFALLEEASQSYSKMFKDQTAAAAYCAPSLTLYDLCELETGDGILPMNEIQISRGGIFFTTGPDFASIFNGAGYWNYTEAQVIANTIKPCMEIPCPPFEEQRLRNLGVCVTAGILQRRGFPELIARFIRGAMIAHLHRINAFVLAQMAAGSTLVDFSPIPAGSLVSDSTASGLLAAAEMVAVDIRYRNRLAVDAVLEVVFPVWALAQLRADVSRRTGVDMVSVPDAEIMSWFTDRHLMLRLVYDWQDAFSGVAAGPGAAAPGITTFPADVEFMIYPPGTWVKGVDDTIRLETVYDSTKLSTNQYTALFTEEGVLVAKVCPDSRRVVYPLCPTGATTDQVTRSCA